MSIVDRFTKSAAAHGRKAMKGVARQEVEQVGRRAVMQGDKLVLSGAKQGLKASGKDVVTIAAKGGAHAPIKVGTFNMHNLFPDDPAVLARSMAKAKTPEEKRALAQALRELNADVVGVQEVYDTRSLKGFLDEFAPDLGYKYVHVGTGTDRRGINVGIVSRLPLTNLQSHGQLRARIPGTNDIQPLSRSLLQGTVTTPSGYEFDMFVIHLKSSNPGKWSDIVEEAQRRGLAPEALKEMKMDRARLRREAEAQSVRDFMVDFEKRSPNRNYVLVGDSNDHIGTGTYKILRGLHDQLPDLADPLTDLPADAITFHSKWNKSRIDVVQTSPGMHKEYVPSSAKVLNSPAAEAASDHYPPSILVHAVDR